MDPAMKEATPRVNYEAMQRFQGRMVVLAGEVKNFDNGRVVLRTPDDVEVTVNANPQTAIPWDSQFVEIIGRVVDSNTLQEETHTNFGSNFDMRLYNEMCKLTTGKYSTAFI